MTVTRDQNTARTELLFKAINVGNLSMVKALATLDDQSKINSSGRTPIAQAAFIAKKDIVDYLFNQIIEPNLDLVIYRDLKQNDSFQLSWVVLFAVDRYEFNNDIKYLEQFIKSLYSHGAKGCSCSYENTSQNALHIAAQKGIHFKSILEVLLQHATAEQFNKPDANGKTPLNDIIIRSDSTIIKLCITLGFVKSHDVLFAAISKDNLSLVQTVATIEDQSETNSHDLTPIAQAASVWNKEIVDYLFIQIIVPNCAKNMTLNQDDHFQLNKVVLYAINHYANNYNELIGNVKYLESFIKDLFFYGASGCHFHFSDTLQNALHITAQKGIQFKNILEVLLQHATAEQFNKPDANGKTPLNDIIIRSESTIIKLCITLGFVKSHDVLFAAILKDNLSLVEKFANIEDQSETNSHGLTPIAQAASVWNKDIVDFLFSKIIVPNLEKNMTLNQDDHFQLNKVVLYAINHYANNYNELMGNVKYLENFIKDLFFYGASGCHFHFSDTLQNALHITAQKGYLLKKILELLIQHANWDQINKLDYKNKLPLDYAFDSNNDEISKMLVQWESKKYLISFFIIFRGQRLPELELFVKIAGYLSELDQIAINLLQEKIKKLPDYDFIVKASCALENHKEQAQADQPSIAFFKKVEDSLKKNKIQDRASEAQSSMQEFLRDAKNNQGSAIASLKKFGLIPITNDNQSNENKDESPKKVVSNSF